MDSSANRIALMSLKILSVLAKWSDKLTVQMLNQGVGSQLACVLESGGLTNKMLPHNGALATSFASYLLCKKPRVLNEALQLVNNIFPNSEHVAASSDKAQVVN